MIKTKTFLQIDILFKFKTKFLPVSFEEEEDGIDP